MDITVEIMREDWADPAVPLPDYATAGAAGADLRANFPQPDRGGVVVAPGARALVPTGLRVAVPPGWEMQLRGRSGLALRHGIGLANAPGTVDADYRGAVAVIVVNWGEAPFRVAHGARIAQAVLAPVARAAFASVPALTGTARGAGGFGSTGAD